MTIKLGMLLLGSLLIYAGWKNLDVRSLLFGDNLTPKDSSSWVPSSGGNAASSGAKSAGAGAVSSQPQAPAATAPTSAQTSKQTTGAETKPWYAPGGYFINTQTGSVIPG